jgi:hypothetical protein
LSLTVASLCSNSLLTIPGDRRVPKLRFHSLLYYPIYSILVQFIIFLFFQSFINHQSSLNFTSQLFITRQATFSSQALPLPDAAIRVFVPYAAAREVDAVASNASTYCLGA